MNDPLEEILRQLTPRCAAPELREATVAAARDTFAVRAPRRWDLWCGAVVAAALLLGVGLNVWVVRADESRFAELYGPEPLPRHLAEAADSIESVTNPETGQWVRRQWQVAQTSRRRSSKEAVAQIRRHYQSILDELALIRTEPTHVENIQMDRDRPRRRDGDASHHFRRPRLYQQYTA